MKSCFRILVLLGVTWLLAGCGPTLINNTPNPMPPNPSGIYTLSLTVKSEDGAILRDSLRPKVVIDGETYPMRASDVGRRVFDFDYVMPEGREKALYYYVLDYEVDYNGSPSPRQVTSSDVYELNLISRYVISMASQRGPVGSEIAVVGSGFKQTDKIIVGGFEARTTYASPNAITFVVPSLPKDASYPVELKNQNGRQLIGEFHVDGSRLRASPRELRLSPGQRSSLSFAIDAPAPMGGLPVEVKTDASASIIMPQVIIPEGQRTHSVPVEGGEPGQGTLFINAQGFNESRVRLLVQPRPSPSEEAFSAPSVEEEQVFILNDATVAP